MCPTRSPSNPNIAHVPLTLSRKRSALKWTKSSPRLFCWPDLISAAAPEGKAEVGLASTTDALLDSMDAVQYQCSGHEWRETCTTPDKDDFFSPLLPQLPSKLFSVQTSPFLNPQHLHLCLFMFLSINAWLDSHVLDRTSNLCSKQ